MKELYPIFLDLTDRLCVVIGGGNVAFRKARSLADAGAKLRVVAPVICPEIAGEFSTAHEVVEKEYDTSDITAAYLVVAATDDAGLNTRIAADCRERGILINAVDQPDDCDFHVPAVVNRGRIQIAVSTSGHSPAMAGWLKREIDRNLGPRLGEGLGIIAEARSRLIESDPAGFDERAKGFREFFESDIWRGFLDGKRELSVEEVVEWISSFTD